MKRIFDTMTRLEIKELRQDAKRLETVARHLRQKAKALTKEQRDTLRAEAARASFFSKKARIDPDIIITPKAQACLEAQL